METVDDKKAARRAYERAYREKNRERLAAEDRARYAKNKEKKAAANALYRATHAAEIQAHKKQYRDARKEHLKAQNQNYYRQNKDRIAKARKQYRTENPDAVNAANRQRQLSKTRRTPAWVTADDLWIIREAYALARLRTALFGFEWHVDHIVPLNGKYVSGLHVPTNIQVIPGQINCQKSNKMGGF